MKSCIFFIQKPSTLLHQVEEAKSVIGLLLETLAQLSDGEFEKFKYCVLSEISHQRDYSSFHWEVFAATDLLDTVFLMVQMYNQWVVEKTVEVLKKMKKNDLVLGLLKSSAGDKGKTLEIRPDRNSGFLPSAYLS